MLPFAACNKEDPALIQQREQQRAQIAKLEGELNLLTEKLRNPPEDKREELLRVKAKSELLKKEVGELEASIAGLETQKKDLEDEMSDYQRKYPLR
ncbi:hypothetical protein [Haloferula sargassicola]|uniref:hypothetical protein n=1 Tax=Haloferula sargassicola TaxID=490096 RepID=UPI00336589DB